MDNNFLLTNLNAASSIGSIIDIIRKICQLVPDPQEQEILIEMIKAQLKGRDQILERAIRSEAQMEQLKSSRSSHPFRKTSSLNLIENYWNPISHWITSLTGGGGNYQSLKTHIS